MSAPETEPAPQTKPASASRPSLLGWLLACALGEAVGLSASGLASAIFVPSLVDADASEDEIVLVLRAAMVAAGALEGALLGVVQWQALRRHLEPARGAPWIFSTAVGLAAGWLLGTLASSFEHTVEPGPATVLLVGATAGLCLGLVTGALQALVLRGRAPVTSLLAYVGASGAAWALGMMVSYAGAALTPEGPYSLAGLALSLATGASVGAVVGAVTYVPLGRAVG